MDFIGAEKELEDYGHKQGRKISKTGFLGAVALGTLAVGAAVNIGANLTTDSIKEAGATKHVGKKLQEWHKDFQSKWDKHAQRLKDAHEKNVQFWTGLFVDNEPHSHPNSNSEIKVTSQRHRALSDSSHEHRRTHSSEPPPADHITSRGRRSSKV